MNRKAAVVMMAMCVLTVMAGCGTLRDTQPGRTATEQLLISTAADRAVAMFPSDKVKGKAVFVDVTNLEANDKAYVVQLVRDNVERGGGSVAAAADKCDILLSVASGALSVDRRAYMFGLPAIPLVIPGAGTMQTPELNIFKLELNRGKAKMLFTATDAKTSQLLWETPLCYGLSKHTSMWLLLTGPYIWDDIWPD